MGSLERKMAAPSALPERIAEVVSSLQSDTVYAPRNLSLGLISRLDDIAQFNGGQVPLHGRLFAQWMHHAYPRECVFPDVRGSEIPVSLDTWYESEAGSNAEVDEMDMKFHAAKHSQPLSTPLEIPWMLAEDFVAEEWQAEGSKGSPRRRLSSFVLTCAALAALVSFGVSLAKAARPVSSRAIVEAHFV